MSVSIRFLFIISLFSAFSLARPLAAAETVNPDLLRKEWKARWITHPDGPQREFGVFYFRKTLQITAAPLRYVVHVSGDNRYQFFINGTRVLTGPARGDLLHWRFESFDLSHFLRPGKNVLAAVVWNYAGEAPMAQMTSETGFIVQGDDEFAEMANTDASWKCLKDDALALLPAGPTKVDGYFVAGPGEVSDENVSPEG